jgi:alpha/beta superfamily hydrolase
MRFNDVSRDTMTLHSTGKYAEALAFLEGYDPEDIDQRAQIAYWRACLLSLMKDPAGALRVLTDAMDDHRIWYSPATLREDDDLVSLRAEPGFGRLLEMAEDRFLEARASEAGKHLVFRRNRAYANPRGVVVILHGNNSNLHATQRAWEPLLEDGWTLLFVESSQIGYYTFGRVWNDYSRAREDIISALDSLTDSERNFLVLAGFSRGARTAIQLALDGSVPATAVFAHEPAPSEGFASWYGEARPRSIPVYLTIGEEDPDRNMSEEIARVIGESVRVRILAGASHEYPERFSDLIRDTLNEAR